MSTPAAPPPVTPPPVPAGAQPMPEARAEDLDLEEDIAPNLGGEDQMQDA